MKSIALALFLLVSCLGCSFGDRAPAPAAPAAPAAASAIPGDSPEPSRPSTQARVFGAALTPGTETVDLAAIAAEPAAFEGRTVRTRGTIVRVCQRMGCWMEMSADGTPAVRVPMAGHAFFLPRDVVGRPALVEGRVRTVPLTVAAREHLASEGAEALSDSFALEATSVRVD